jgi:RDD family protein
VPACDARSPAPHGTVAAIATTPMPIDAPLRRRAAAGTLDAVPFTVAAVAVYRRMRRDERSSTTRTDRSVILRQRARRFTVARLLRAGYVIVPMAVIGATPGQLIAGVRVVDAETGGRPTWAQVLGRWAIDETPGLLLRVALRPMERRNTASLREVEARVDDLMREESEGRDDETDVDLDELNAKLKTAFSTDLHCGPLLLGTIVAVGYHVAFGRRVRDALTHTRVVVVRR